MTSCPRCDGQLELRSGGLLRDAHGAFVPRSSLRSASSFRAAAALAAALPQGRATSARCPSCRASLREVDVALAGQPALHLDGCPSCGGFWFDTDELHRLRRVMLARPQVKPRSVGGYGGTTVSRAAAASPAAEGLFSMLEMLGAFL